jgi:hypothetical protein
MRARLPNRRLAVTENLTWRDQDFIVRFGFDRAGAVKEIFLDGAKTGADIEALMDDGCILVSIALQAGSRVGELSRSMGRSGSDPADGPGVRPASLLGAVLARAAVVEHKRGPEIAEAYRELEARGLIRAPTEEAA